MNVALWVIAGVLALAFLVSGAMKLTQPTAKLAESGQAWVKDFPDSAVRVIGALEVLASLGLVLPGLFETATVLVPLAAAGLVLLMIGGAITHGRRAEYANIAINAIFAGLALFVAIQRFGDYSL